MDEIEDELRQAMMDVHSGVIIDAYYTWIFP